MDIVIFNRDDCIDEFGARFRIYIFRKLLKLKVSDSQFIADKIANCQPNKKDVSTTEAYDYSIPYQRFIKLSNQQLIIKD